MAKKKKAEQITMMEMLDPYEREKRIQQENFYRAKLETLYMKVNDRYGFHHKDMPDGLVVIQPMSRWINDEYEMHWYRCVVGHHDTISGTDVHIISAPNEEWPDEPLWQPHHGVRWIYPEGTLWTRTEPEMDPKVRWNEACENCYKNCGDCTKRTGPYPRL